MLADTIGDIVVCDFMVLLFVFLNLDILFLMAAVLIPKEDAPGTPQSGLSSLQGLLWPLLCHQVKHAYLQAVVVGNVFRILSQDKNICDGRKKTHMKAFS